MHNNVMYKVEEARNFFEIKEFPSNFFNLIEDKGNYIEKYNLLIFKEDIGKLSGFIGYGDNELTTICINYKRPIGHQNFTLAHEIGHWFLHRGQAISDTDANMASMYAEEKEANEFASEILYPAKCIDKDYDKIMSLGLLEDDKRKELAIEVDELCHKYCLSFDNVLRKMLYRSNIGDRLKTVKKEIVKALGCTLSNYFQKDYYVVNEELQEYKEYQIPYDLLKKYVEQLKKDNKIGTATAEAILFRNGLLDK
ncbi:ImmA/IrrE family metallo-endopeptidase [[Clostridium] fimetarium]|uniref:IrrE N-terminal-like domain-containing protein n=1 Tax=[Clostridium] fimetarium TaxID=99656 RepID=A0A1I0QUR7_9FIRM|nr:ImmA/IrrE family metallo-endopeptidase [[Clostridium] fimetarium]SEW31378.1 protein of unknown function [[Clostridium] fimetarium]